MPPTYQTASQKSLALDQRIASGGEGEIWTISGRADLVAKIYHPKNTSRAKEMKLKAMVASPPRDDMLARYGHVSIAWPSDLLYQGGAPSERRFAGFVMPRLEKSFTVFEVYNPALRKKNCPGFNWKYLLHTALNLSIALEALHDRNYIMGDINEGNILVTARALITLIDTDSYQVQDPGGTMYRCPVGKIEFTPPELQEVRFDRIDRRPEHDYFGLGVLVFLLLMEGNHPFAGVLKIEDPGGEPASVFCLRKGAFPYIRNRVVSPRPLAPRFAALPPGIQRLLIRCFVEGHRNPAARPSPAEWVQVLAAAEGELQVCRQNAEHYYSQHLRQCPWCEREPALARAAGVRAAPAPGPAPVATQTAVQPTQAAPGAVRQAQPQPAQALSQPAQVVSQPAPWLPTFSLPRPRLGRWRWQVGRRRFKSLFRSARRPLTGAIWWSEARRYVLFGGFGGLLLFTLGWLVFQYPSHSGIVSGVLAGAAIGLCSVLLARFFYRHGRRSDYAMALAVLVLGGILAVTQGMKISGLAGQSLENVSLSPLWWLGESLLLGLAGGLAYGNYRVLLRRRSPALAWLTSLAVAALPLLGMILAGLFGLAFRVSS